MTREEVKLLQQKISHYKNSSKSKLDFHTLTLTHHPTFIRTIMNQDIQQKLYDQLTNVVKQAQIDMFNLYMKTAEIQMKTYDQQYTKELEKMFKDRKHNMLPYEQQLTTVMIDLLERRTNNRNERIQYVNQFKIDCLRSNSSNHK